MKRQKWLTGILVVMLVTSLLLAVGTFAPIVAAGGGGGIEPLVVGARVEDSPQLNLPESPFCSWVERALCL